MKLHIIIVNVRFSLINSLRYLTIFLCSCCFQPTTTWLSFRCWHTLINPFTDCFHWAKSNPFPETVQLLLFVRYPKPSFRNVSIRALSSNWLFYRNGPALVSPAADHATRLWCWSCSAEPWCLLTAVQCHVITTELTLTRPRNSIHWVTECGTFPPPSRTISIPT